jgi:hypothetical protein
MPVPIGTKKDKATIAQLKRDYVDYFRDCPIHKYACKFIGRDEATVITWRHADVEFQNQIDLAEAFFLRKETNKVDAKFKLERLYKEHFAERTEHTGANGEKLEGLIIMKDGSTP